jgi:hypothetical protein
MFFSKSPQQQMQEQLVKVRFLINTLNKNSAKSKQKEKQFIKKAKKALANNDEGTASVYARQAIQHKSMALKLLKLACRMDIFETQVKTQIETNKMSRQLVSVIGDLTQLCGPDMTLNNINEFEKMMDDATVASNYAADVLDGSTADGASTAEEKEMLGMLKDSLDLEFKSTLSVDFPVIPAKDVKQSTTEKHPSDLF